MDTQKAHMCSQQASNRYIAAHRVYSADTEQVHSGHSAGAMQALDCDLPEGRLLFILESPRFPITLSGSPLKQ